MIRVVDKPVSANWENIPLDGVVYIIERSFTTFNADLLRMEVNPADIDKFKCGKLHKKEDMDRGVFKYTVTLSGIEEKVVFNINEYYFKLE